MVRWKAGSSWPGLLRSLSNTNTPHAPPSSAGCCVVEQRVTDGGGLGARGPAGGGGAAQPHPPGRLHGPRRLAHNRLRVHGQFGRGGHRAGGQGEGCYDWHPYGCGCCMLLLKMTGSAVADPRFSSIRHYRAYGCSCGSRPDASSRSGTLSCRTDVTSRTSWCVGASVTWAGGLLLWAVKADRHVVGCRGSPGWLRRGRDHALVEWRLESRVALRAHTHTHTGRFVSFSNTHARLF